MTDYTGMFEIACMLAIYLLVFSELDLENVISLMSPNSRQPSPRVPPKGQKLFLLA